MSRAAGPVRTRGPHKTFCSLLRRSHAAAHALSYLVTADAASLVLSLLFCGKVQRWRSDSGSRVQGRALWPEHVAGAACRRLHLGAALRRLRCTRLAGGLGGTAYLAARPSWASLSLASSGAPQRLSCASSLPRTGAATRSQRRDSPQWRSSLAIAAHHTLESDLDDATRLHVWPRATDLRLTPQLPLAFGVAQSAIRGRQDRDLGKRSF